MAREVPIQVLRTTRANLNSQASANGLLVGEPYLITDESRLAIGTAADGYEAMAKESEAGGGALQPYAATLLFGV